MILEVTDITGDELIQKNDTMVLVFSAEWCGPCKMMVPMWDDISEKNDGLVIGKINVDNNMLLKEKYNVSGVPSIFFIKNGIVVDRQNGASPKSVIQAKINLLLG